jgi:hypothetical protein
VVGLRVILTLLLLSACGRFSFDPVGADASGGVELALDASADTAVRSRAMLSNYGGADTLTVARGDDVRATAGPSESEDHALVRFDLAEIPAGSSILAARVELSIATAAPGSIEIRLVTEDWIEGTGVTGEPGEANWSFRTPTVAWTEPGGTIGPELASLPVGSAGPIAAELPAATVQGWLDDPASSQGVLLRSNDLDEHDVVELSSREASPTERPRLAVTYVPP